jgi:YtkA-like
MSTSTRKRRAVYTMWIPLLVVAITIAATTAPRPRGAESSSGAVVNRITVARVTDIPSHNRLYRASLDLTSSSGWILRLRSASGMPIRNAAVAIDAWMPEQEGLAHVTPTTTEYLGGGMYRVTPVALEQRGWWNISVRISAAGRTDSLGFNVILR